MHLFMPDAACHTTPKLFCAPGSVCDITYYNAKLWRGTVLMHLCTHKENTRDEYGDVRSEPDLCRCCRVLQCNIYTWWIEGGGRGCYGVVWA